MKDAPSQKALRTRGVWFFTETMGINTAIRFAQRIESLGYSTLWLPETIGRDPFAHIAALAANTTTLRFATGIASIFNRHPGAMKQVAATLAEQSGGRFTLGLGVSHAPMVEGIRNLDFSKPLSTMRAYLNDMDTAPYVAVAPKAEPLRLLAALGPKMLDLAAQRTDGAHPYWTTPEHTEMARARMGPGPLLCVEQKVVLTTDRTAAHTAANAALGMYTDLPNYRNNWNRLGFSDTDIDSRKGRFVDAVVAWGDADTIRARLDEHTDAGADHVCIQPLSTTPPVGTPDWEALEGLKPGC